ncbi:MAG TPA: ABC transporter permease [Thermoanaerobaculia bacterium]|jgi:putative ABC transport system permease protein|nr:ABC transporter permease [Thermoanaerobaculia bacterium]
MSSLPPRWRKVGRDLWLHKSRTLLVVAAIVVGIVGSGAVLDSWWLLRGVTREQYRASNPANATLRVDGIDGALLARVRRLPMVRQVQARRTVAASAAVEGAWRAAILFVYDDPRRIAIGGVNREDGAWPPPDGAVVVEASSREYARVGLGSTLTLQVGGGPPAALPVAGVARDVGLAPGWMENVVYAFVSRATLARLGVEPSLDELQLTVRGDAFDRDAVRRTAFAVKAEVEAAGHRVRDVDVPVPGRHVHAAQINSLLMTQGAFGVLALLSSGLLVVNLITAMLAGQVREIGVMKAIGARGGQLAAMYLVLAAALGLAACAIGLPAAAWIGRRYAELNAELLNFDLGSASLAPAIILPQLAAGALLPVLAAAVPILRGCRIAVGEALRDFGIAPPATQASRRPRSNGRLARPLLLALRNAFRRRQRTVLTLLTLAVGGAVYVGALNLRAAVRGSVDLLFGGQRFDVVVRLARPYPPLELETAARAVDGVARAEAWAGARAVVQHGDGTLGNAFALTAPPAGSPLFAPRLERGRWARAGAAELVVGRRLVDDEPGLRVGDAVPLLVAGRPSRWRVVGLVDSGPSPQAYTTREALAPLVGAGVATLLVDARLDGAAAQVDLLQRLRGELEARGLEVQSGQLMAQQRKVIEDHLLMVVAFLGIMGQLTILVGGLGLASTMSLAVLERTREIGVLRAIGARHGAILALVQVEGLVVALGGWLAALPLSLVTSVLLGEAFGRVMFRVPVRLLPDAAGVLRWLALVVVVSLLACAWPAWRATRIPTAAALAYE